MRYENFLRPRFYSGWIIFLLFKLSICTVFIVSSKAFLIKSIVQSRKECFLDSSSKSNKLLHLRAKGNIPDNSFFMTTTPATKDFDCDHLFTERFQRRKYQLSEKIEKERANRPPNPEYCPQKTITEILRGLSHCHDPIRYFGVDILLRSSTDEWFRTLLQSIGVDSKNMPNSTISSPGNNNIKLQQMAPTLYRAMKRPNQQFRILLEKNSYWVEFPTDILELEEGECWVECRLRELNTNKLLVVLGWTLQKRKKEEDCESSWFVHKIDWQDFRDQYRPGIGREEWERICG